MAKRGVKRRRGRVQVAMALAAFLCVAAGVIWRRSYGYTASRELLVLDHQRVELEAQRAKLVTDIRTGMSLGRLAPIVSQRLGMRIPSDSQVIRLPRPTPRRGS